MKLQLKRGEKDVKHADFSLKIVILGRKIAIITNFKPFITLSELMYGEFVVLLPVKRFLMVKVYG
jgi:hypothetical protein